MATIADTLQAGLEQVAPIVRDYRDADQGLLRHFKPSKRATTTRQLYRIPYRRYSGGVQAKSSMDGGVVPGGTGPVLGSLKAGWIDSVLTFEVTQEQIDLSQSSEQSRISIVTDILSNAMKTALDHTNINLFGDGTGKLTNSSSASASSTTLTFAGATDTLRTNRLFRGLAVDVWNSTGATKRSGGPYTITAINHTTGVVTLHAAPPGMVSGDLLAVYNADVYGPSTLVSFSSTWPGDAESNGAGLTGDSFIHGLEYANDATTSNHFLTKLKSSFPELVPSTKDLEGEALTFSHAELIKSLMIQARDETVVEGAYAVMHTAQQAALKAAAASVSVWERGGGNNKMVNLQPGDAYNNTFTWGEFTAFAVKAANKARVDIFKPDVWGTVEGHPTEWYRSPDGGSMFERKRNGDGARLNAYELSLKMKYDFVCEDPGCGAFLTNIAVPSGF